MPQAPRRINDIIRPHKKAAYTIQRSTIVVIAIFFITIASIGTGWLWMNNEVRPVQQDTYQAVTLTNNQIYFGKITQITPQTITLKEVYYVIAPKTSSEESPSEAADTAVLRSIESTTYSPQDVLYIQKDQVMHWQNLKKDSQIVKTITSR